MARFAEGLQHPRTMLTLPNGDVLVAETRAPPGKRPSGITGFFMGLFMSRVGAADPSANRIALLRDADGDGRAEARFALRSDGPVSPSGMAWRDGKLYVANHDAVLAFDLRARRDRADRQRRRKLMDLPGGGNHWMRNLLLSARRQAALRRGRLGLEHRRERDGGRSRAAPRSGRSTSPRGRRRQFAGGLRNPNGMAWNPSSGELWTVVNERDMLGPDLVPDYLTNVPVGAQYGWPWVYWKDEHRRAGRGSRMPEFLTEYTRKPEYALGAARRARSAWLFATRRHSGWAPDFANGAFIARHGSWNRKPLAGYDVVFVPLRRQRQSAGHAGAGARPASSTGNGETHGRPTWVAWDKAGALLVSDDTAGHHLAGDRAGRGAVGGAQAGGRATRMPPQRDARRKRSRARVRRVATERSSPGRVDARAPARPARRVR